MPFCIMKFFDIHVSFDSQQGPGSILVKECDLLASINDHQMGACWVEGNAPDCIAGEWLHNSKTVHVSVHAVEIPQTDMVIETTCGHSNTLWIDCYTWYCFSVASETGKAFDRYSQLIKWFIGAFDYLLQLFVLVSIVLSLLIVLDVAGLLLLLLIFWVALDIHALGWTDHLSNSIINYIIIIE